MKFTVLSLFPEVITQGLVGLVGSAKDKGLYDLEVCDLRPFGKGQHKALDDEPYGGGDGMLLQAEPLSEALESIRQSSPEMQKAKVVYLSPKGKLWTQKQAWAWAQEAQPKILICGRYAGVDQRFIDECCDEEISIGDYVLNGGELAALVIMESVIRLRQGALGNQKSIMQDSFSDMEDSSRVTLLEAPQYTRPSVWKEKSVPKILLSGHHEKIQKWSHVMALLETAWRRPELLTSENKKELQALFGSSDLTVQTALEDFGWEKVMELKGRDL